MLTITAVCLLTALSSNTVFSEEPSPNLGDVRINNPTFSEDGVVFGEAQVFLTDGFSPPTWSSICNNRFLLNEAGVFCNQLGGYSKAELLIGDISNGDYPIWISDLNCTSKSFTNIFHCDYTIKSRNENCSSQSGKNIVAYVKCSERSSNPDTFYSGQVALCPPDTDNQTYRAQSVSFGIVSIYLYHKWGALTFDSGKKAVPEVINNYRGNLICRQMGFQQVVQGSVQTLSSYENDYSFSHCFTDNDGLKLSSAWITTDDLTCQESPGYSASIPCFSCCYRYPPPDVTKILPQKNYIVLQCMYDVYSRSAPYGNETTCSFTDGGNGMNIIKYEDFVCCTPNPHTAKHILFVLYCLV